MQLYRTIILKKLRKSILLLASILIVFTGCEDRWEEMNTDPNRLEKIPDEFLFTSAVRSTFRASKEYAQLIYGGQYAHIYLAESKYREFDKYYGNAINDIQELLYNRFFQGAIRNITEVLQLTSDGEYENEYRNAQAQIIAVVNFTMLSDFYGDIPYFEGGMGKYGISEPAYDPLEDVYADMELRLKNVIATLNKSEAANKVYPSDVDPIYHGNIENWIRFANSIRLRIAMRARFVDPQKYEPIIVECLSNPLIEDNTQNPTLENLDSDDEDLYNPWHQFIIDNEAGLNRILFAEAFINTLKSTHDPRLSFFATKNKEGEYLGQPNGLEDNPYTAWDKSNTSRPSSEFFAKPQPSFLITTSEIWFYRAEAALFNIFDGNANQLYQTGIEMAMSQWNINADSITNYLSSEPEASLSGDQENQFRQIATQLWISHVPNAHESWCTIRRTGYPVIEQRTASSLSKGVTDGNMPVRLYYPATKERSINGYNIDEAIDRLPGGEDKIDSPVWWDVR